MLLDEIGQHLEDESIGTQGTDLFTGIFPDTPNDLISVLESGGRPPVHAFGVTLSAPAWEEPTFQVLSRSTSYATARTNAESAYKKLDGLVAQTLSSVLYLSIFAIQSPFSIGRDQNDRSIIAFNCVARKKRS